MKIISCPHCDMKYRIDPAKFQQSELRIRCKKCSEAFSVDLVAEDPADAAPPAPAPTPPDTSQESTPPPPPPPPATAHPGQPAGTEVPISVPSPPAGDGPLALLAHESDELRSDMAEMLSDDGFRVIVADNGVDALMIIEQHKPAVAVLDVALPKMFGFEVCEIVNRDPDLEHVRMLLIAAIYDQTKYKRRPTNLYGAHDYIEKHHIPDSLTDKCRRLISDESDNDLREEETSRIVTPQQEEAEEASRERIREAEFKTDLDKEDLERARRLARTIISDIALYNQDKIETGIRAGNLEEVLADELEEGRQLLAGRLADGIRDAEPYLETALAQLIETKQKEFGVEP